MSRTLTGIGLKNAHLPALWHTPTDLGFVEVHSENFFAEGGACLTLLERVRERFALSLHGVGLALGSILEPDAWHLDRLVRLVERFEPQWVSEHACWGRAALGAAPVWHAADLLPLPCNEAALSTLARHVQQVQERLRRPILIENLSAYLDPPGSTMSESAWFAELVRRTGCKLLLDINNLYVNACNRALVHPELDPMTEVRAFLSQLEPEWVGEYHLAGHARVEFDAQSYLIDDHGSAVCDEVWQLYRDAVARLGPKPTLIEWDHRVPPLEVLLAQADLAARHMQATASRSRPPDEGRRAQEACTADEIGVSP